MKDYLWDGEMDFGWEDLSEFLVKTCNKFTKTMLETVKFSSNDKSKELISEECMDRFEKITSILANIISEGIYYQAEDMDSTIQSAERLNCWILLGSLTETAFQIFIAFYMDDYENTQWQMWEDFDAEKVQPLITESIQKLVDHGILKTEYSRSLKKAIKDAIKEHTKEHKVQKVMLDELIQLYISLELLDDDEISYLRSIQSNRNGIHSFESRTIGTWFDLQYCVRFFCYMLEWIEMRLPDIPDVDCYY